MIFPLKVQILQLDGDSRFLKIVFVRELLGGPGNYTANLQVLNDLGVETAPEHGTNITIRRRFSLVRLTGHDFPDIGTGNFGSILIIPEHPSLLTIQTMKLLNPVEDECSLHKY